MAYSEYFVDRVRNVLKRKVINIVEKKMMGGIIFMVNDKMCVGVDIDKNNKNDRLMVRVGKEKYDDLLQIKGCREMDFTGKAMKGFIFVYPEGLDKEEDLEFWIEKGIEFNNKIKNK